MKKYSTILLLMATILLSSLIPGRHSSASQKKPVFAQKYQQITVGKTRCFTLKYIKKSYKIIYASSNKRIASIGKNSGKCTGKKPGKVTISAKIYNKRNKKLFTVKHSLRIIKSSLLPNAAFHMVQSINPYDFTVKIGCSRILLKKEVKKSKLLLKKKGSTSSFTASFSALSSNGKELTYTLTSSSQKKFCPKDGSMNGTFTLSSSLFRKKFSLTYRERLGNYALSGYVFSIEGSPVNGAYVKCMSKNSVKTCYTNSNGYYHLEAVKNPSSLTITKSGYLSEILTDLTTSAKNTRCENIFLHRQNQNDFSAQFHVTEQGGTAIPQASIYLSDGKNTVFAETNQQGNILLYTNTIPSASPCTKWSIGQQKTLTYESNFIPNTSYRKKIQSISLEKNYTLLIGKNPQENSPGYEFYKFTFCPKDYISQQFYFDVKLSDCNALSLRDLSLKCDSAAHHLCSYLHLSLYQKGCTKPVFKTCLSEAFFSIENHVLSFTQYLPCSLPDGSYYVVIKMLDKEEKPICVFPMTPLSVIKGKSSSRELSCLPLSYGRVLAYGDFIQTDATASFEQYQWMEGQYFYLDTLTTEAFQGKEWDTKTSNLIIPSINVGNSYLLVPVKKDISGKTSIKFTASEDSVYSDRNTALNSPPLSMVACVSTSENFSPELPPELMPDTASPEAACEITATKSYVRSCSSYPNSVTVFYKKEGTFLSATLTTSPSENIGTWKSSQTIMDIYTNGKSLYTTQTSYH